MTERQQLRQQQFVVFQKAKFVGNRRGPSACIRGVLTVI